MAKRHTAKLLLPLQFFHKQVCYEFELSYKLPSRYSHGPMDVHVVSGGEHGVLYGGRAGYVSLNKFTITLLYTYL